MRISSLNPAAAVKKTGFTVLEVIVAIFIFGCVSAALFQFIAQSDRIRGRALFVEGATQLAANESERLRNIATQNGAFEDSTYVETITGRSFSITRHIIENDDIGSTNYNPLRSPLEPVEVELLINDASNSDVKPLRFKLLVGNDQP